MARNKKDSDILSIELDDIDFDFEIEADENTNKFIKLQNHNISGKDILWDNAYMLAYNIHIQRGECIYVNLDGNFVFGDFVGAFITANSLQVEELTIISLSGGIDNFEMMDELINSGYVEKINLVLSNYFLRTEQKKHTPTIKYLSQLVTKHGQKFNVYYADNHSKSVLIKTKQGGHVCIHGSANLRSSSNIEQMIIQENKELYEFNYKFFNSLK